MFAVNTKRSAVDVVEDWAPTEATTSTIPGNPRGVVTVQLVVVVQTTPVAGLFTPKVNAVAPGVVSNPVPVTVTTVPPPTGPLAAVTAATVGGATTGEYV